MQWWYKTAARNAAPGMTATGFYQTIPMHSRGRGVSAQNSAGSN